MATIQKKQCESDHYYIGADIDNRYKLTQFIGAGGMACVYRAKEMNTPHDFALKFLKAEYHNMDYLVKYFEDEASSMRDLAHPNIVRFYRFENREDYSYIVMDYVDGFALSDVLKLSRKQSTSMPLDEVVRVMIQIARALDAIHRDNFVHRDIKPSNVLIDRRTGQAFLTDLGITSIQGVKIEGAGTIAYMSPEQSETWTADHRSDIYAYGILIYEMLTGKRPFNVTQGLSGAEAEADLLRKHKESPIPDVTAIRGDLPKELNGIITKAMAKKPDARYQSVIEFAQDVHEVLQAKLSPELQEFATIQHRQIAAPGAVADNSSQNILRFLLLIGIAVIILASLIVYSIATGGGLPFISTQTPLPTATATATNTPQPTVTPTENPIESNNIIAPFLTGINAFVEPDSTDSLVVIPNNGENFNYLRVGFVNNFRVVMDINNSENSGRYGVAFRMQDAENYHYFALDPASLDWEITNVLDNSASVQKRGTFDSLPTQITVAGIDNFFEIRSGRTVITYESEHYATGSLAVYIEDGELLLDDIQVSLLGQEGIAIAMATPTQTVGLADPLRFLRIDLQAMLASADINQLSLDCPIFIEIYDALETHNNSENANVRRFAQDVRDESFSLDENCRIESPDETMNIRENVPEFVSWYDNLEFILEDIGE